MQYHCKMYLMEIEFSGVIFSIVFNNNVKYKDMKWISFFEVRKKDSNVKPDPKGHAKKSFLSFVNVKHIHFYVTHNNLNISNNYSCNFGY